MKAKKGCGQLFSNETFFDENRFSVVKTEKEASAEVVAYSGTAKMSHKRFFLSTLKNNEMVSDKVVSFY